MHGLAIARDNEYIDLGELRALIAGQRGGKSDAQLGIDGQGVQQKSAALQQVFALALDPNATVPDNQTLDQLQGGERDWGIDMLLGRLEQGDTRVVQGLQHLGGDRVQLALDDYQAGRRIS